MRILLLSGVLALGLVGCGGSSSPPPGAPSSTTFTLFGAVRGDDGLVVPGAVLTILDSANAGRSATTNVIGAYRFTGLSPAGFSVRVTAADFDSLTRGVQLTADTLLNIELVRLPRAVVENVPDDAQGFGSRTGVTLLRRLEPTGATAVQVRSQEPRISTTTRGVSPQSRGACRQQRSSGRASTSRTRCAASPLGICLAVEATGCATRWC
jgi:hypothetical protein